MEKDKDISSVKTILSQIIKENHWENGINEAQVQNIWKDIAGNAILRYTQEIKLKHNTLTIKITSSALRQELSYKKTKLIELMNKNLNENIIKEVVFL